MFWYDFHMFWYDFNIFWCGFQMFWYDFHMFWYVVYMFWYDFHMFWYDFQMCWHDFHMFWYAFHMFWYIYIYIYIYIYVYICVHTHMLKKAFRTKVVSRRDIRGMQHIPDSKLYSTFWRFITAGGQCSFPHQSSIEKGYPGNATYPRFETIFFRKCYGEIAGYVWYIQEIHSICM